MNQKKVKARLDVLDQVERMRTIELPELYKNFYKRCTTQIPSKWVGADVLAIDDFADWADELLSENNLKNFLDEKDFVFLFHQGYIFWYFKADGTADPMVFSFSEVDKVSKAVNPLSEFIREEH
ncbi:SMI1/KNR4 family protein [Pseudochryseolinea flava]|uniref:Knr4/Smi1-like domain-containing protein n=1 Tax=Pseudochryseolinea flava TaxID=2059302 RepID=A0A364Y4Z9_9BACT|nr:SMI1/KNR4 family protein [Pseudochryseolinea flava]RAW01829.1 hypothetical protein DQQ10_09300 [Pseudochryseolinea flava]